MVVLKNKYLIKIIFVSLANSKLLITFVNRAKIYCYLVPRINTTFNVIGGITNRNSITWLNVSYNCNKTLRVGSFERNHKIVPPLYNRNSHWKFSESETAKLMSLMENLQIHTINNNVEKISKA